MISWRHVAWTGLVLFVGCGSGSPGRSSDRATAISPETFTEVYVALRAAARDAEDVAAFEAEKEKILERHGVSAEALMEFARTHGGDIPAMAELWSTLRKRLEQRDKATRATAEAPDTTPDLEMPPDSAALNGPDSVTSPASATLQQEDAPNGPP